MLSDRRKSPSGCTRGMGSILSAVQGRSNALFPSILALYAFEGARIADVTYGRGSFWKFVDRALYEVLPTDLKTGIDARSLPYEESSIDMVVFDPPYMHSSGSSSFSSGHVAFEKHYKNNAAQRGITGHDEVLRTYFECAKEARRVVRKKGTYVVKCQDEICANVQRLSHVEIINQLSANGWVCEDLFVLIREGTPVTSRVQVQLHARKNHSYFLVFRRDDSGRAWKGPGRS